MTKLTLDDWIEVFRDRVLAVLTVSMLALVILGYLLWIKPQQTQLSILKQQQAGLEQQHNQLAQLAREADQNLDQYPSYLAQPNSLWTLFNQHPQRLQQELATEFRPEEGPLYGLSVKLAPAGQVQPQSYTSPAYHFIVQARGSYTSLARVVQWVTLHQPLFDITQITLTRQPLKPGEYELTLAYRLPIAQFSASVK